MQPVIRQANATDVEVVSAILREAALWLEQRGMPLWKGDELSPERLTADVSAGLFHLAEQAGQPAGTVKFQLEDTEFWPDQPLGEAAYIHRLAVRRTFAGGGISTALMRWAVERTRALGRRYLRLDTDSARPRLRALYERFGFRHHSDQQVGPYHVARYEYDLRRLLG